MSAEPGRLPEHLPESQPQNRDEKAHAQWGNIPVELVLKRIAAAARTGMAVVAAEDANFHASVHPVFMAALVPLSTLKQTTHKDRAQTSNDKSLAGIPNRFPVVVLDTESLPEAELEYLLFALPQSVPIALLYGEDQPLFAPSQANVVFSMANDTNAGHNWAEFQSTRVRNHARLVVLDYMDDENAVRIEQFLGVRNFQVVTATQRLATTFVQSVDGSQIVLVENGNSTTEVAAYIKRLRMSHESDVLSIVVTGALKEDAARCRLLEAGADDLLDSAMSDTEMLYRLRTLSRQQTRSQKIRHDAYRFPGSVAYNAEYLMSVGNKLYASAQRDVITMALGVIRVVFIESGKHSIPTRRDCDEIVQKIASYCGKNLRETDLFAQSGERDFFALVTCVGRNNIARVFTRLSTEVDQLVERSSEGRYKVRLDVGVTCELGVSFRSMIERAQTALIAAERDPKQPIVVN